MTPKIKKKKNSFVYFDENGDRMGSINIQTGKFIGATLCMMQLYEFLQSYKTTKEYIQYERERLEKSINKSTEQFHNDLAKLEQLEKSVTQ